MKRRNLEGVEPLVAQSGNTGAKTNKKEFRKTKKGTKFQQLNRGAYTLKVPL